MHECDYGIFKLDDNRFEKGRLLQAGHQVLNEEFIFFLSLSNDLPLSTVQEIPRISFAFSPTDIDLENENSDWPTGSGINITWTKKVQ